MTTLDRPPQLRGQWKASHAICKTVYADCSPNGKVQALAFLAMNDLFDLNDDGVG